MPDDAIDEEAAIAEIVQRLSVKFPDQPAETVQKVVRESWDEHADAHVRDFVGVLVEKKAKKRLKHLD